jgi:hypothetical protein
MKFWQLDHSGADQAYSAPVQNTLTDKRIALRNISVPVTPSIIISRENSDLR